MQIIFAIELSKRQRRLALDIYSCDGAPVEVVKHEFTISMAPMKEQCGIGAMDIAKGLLDKGYMAPTVYFPLSRTRDV